MTRQIRIEGFLSGKNILRVILMSSAWSRYRRSMDKRRAGSTLGQNSFGHHCRRSEGFIFGDSCVFGETRNGYFVPSHFCPASKREGVEMLKALRAHGQKVAFAVTSDMVSMLEKLGYKNMNQTVAAYFRGEMVEKYILTN